MGYGFWPFGGRNISAAIESKDLPAAFLRGTESGVYVSEESARRLTAVSACVKVLSESVAQLPLILYERKGNGKERATSHPLYKLFHDKPNGWMTSFEYRELMQSHLCLYGNAYSHIVRDRVGRVAELLPIDPKSVEVTQEDNWSITYKLRSKGATKEYSPRDIFHLRGLGADGIAGLSPIRQAANAVGLSTATESYGSRLFKNNARPSGILTTEGNVNKETVDRVKESWNAGHGNRNQLGTAVLDGNWKFQPLSIPNEDAQFLETRKFQISEIARIYRMPPHMIGDLERATFSNVEQMSLEFVQYTLMPWLKRWEQRINAFILDDPRVFVEFPVDALLRGDAKTRAEVQAIRLQNGILNRNEARAQENYNMIPDGDEFHMAANIYGDPSSEQN